jgi:Arc/MetJ-type ribon-helix-helix transcriptional regulator
METVVRFEGVIENVLDELVKAGYFKTKSEAIRAGILELGKEYNILDDLRQDLKYAKEIDAKLKSKELELGSEKEIFDIIQSKKRE